jgi:hypothetical protein
MPLTNFPSGISSQGVPLLGGNQDNSGTTYFVDGNSGVDGNNGKSWQKAFKTLAVAFAASHADIARGADRWARRNTIYIAGDTFHEDLIIFPQKTDVIGVGSMNGFKNACITGDHAPVNAGVGCRFFNIGFEPHTAGTIMTLTGACWGAEFHNCEFRAYGSDHTLTAVKAIDATACNELKVIGCNFVGAFSGDVIDLGAGAVDGLRICDNTIMGGANDGIVVTGTTTVTSARLGLIARNYIYVTAVTISDGADSTLVVIGNRCVTAGALGGTSHVITGEFAADNIVTGAGVSRSYPEIEAPT